MYVKKHTLMQSNKLAALNERTYKYDEKKENEKGKMI